MWCSTPRMPPISSPPPARPGPPCTSAGSGEPCPVDSFASLVVEDQQPAVPRRDAEHHLAGERRVGGDDRAGQAALAACGQLDHLLGVGVRHQRGHRAERLDLVRLGALRVGDQQDRRDERAALGVGADDLDLLRVAEHDPAGVGQRLDAAPHLLALLEAGERAHPHALGGRVADRRSWPAGRDAASTTASRCCAGTNARRIAVHFCPALTVISATTPLTYRSNSALPGRGVRAEDRAGSASRPRR